MEIASIPADTYTLGFIGAGKMAESIARGVVRSGVLPPSRIRTAAHSNPARRDAFESFGVSVLSSNEDVYTVPSPFLLSLKQTSRRFHSFSLTLAGRSRKQRRRSIGQTSIRYCCAVSALIMRIRLGISFTAVCVVAVKDVVSKLTPVITKNKLLVSVAAGVKLKDLQVTNAVYFFSSFLLSFTSLSIL